uniref:Retrovirus-related Pol polyprotein from transposon TNT 1-94 n=1 Tax=Tanacetum cinerariifolium TaxID=118510 RepID=A0A6L2J294_TANCI|nr:retrovirus-related Pol polyprotein from transposon TNT 1-94 [Tanacetum cinerariifolium]
MKIKLWLENNESVDSLVSSDNEFEEEEEEEEDDLEYFDTFPTIEELRLIGGSSNLITNNFDAIFKSSHLEKKKSHALETIMSFIKRVENQNDIHVKQLRSDNGTEFKNNILVNFYDKKGISQDFYSPYTSKQNGVAERKKRTLIEAARTMLSGFVCMQTRSSSRLVSNLSLNPTPSTNPKGRNRRRSKQRIEELNLDKLSPPIVTIADQRTMAQLLQAPTEGYEDAIVVSAITADNFELKHGLLTLVQNKQFFRHDKEDPHAHELHQLDTFYNALNSKDQDSLNFTAGGMFLEKMPRECLAIIESKSKVCYLRNKPVVDKVSTNTSTSGILPDVAELKDMAKALLLDKKSQNQSPAPVKAVEESCVTCGGAHSYRNFSATDGNVYRENIQEFSSQASAVNYNQGNTSYRPPMITQIPPPPSFLPKVVEDEPEATKDTVNPTNNESTEDVQPQVVQSESPVLTSEPVTSSISEPIIAPVSAPKPNPKTSIPYPPRRNDERNREKAVRNRKITTCKLL